MLTIERGEARSSRLPLSARIGVAVLVFGILEDLVAHSIGSPATPDAGHTGAELMGHFIVFVGMVLILAGIVIDGARQAVARRRSARHSSKGVA
jgi:hypothetical protein